jgi:para-aminobenzoate synthetase component 1
VTIDQSATGREIRASPIKGTRPRGADLLSDNRLRAELLTSQKDRAENTMIVDLMRNDLGRVCEFGSVKVDELCRLDAHPTLFHLVSDVSGKLKDTIRYSDVLKAVFPCGSITGAPKIRTMEIIDRIETEARGLSMGAIGCRIASGHSQHGEIFEMSVAIRTMVIRDGESCFNVGGGITIDSDPESEYDESMLKALALLSSLSAQRAGVA